MFKWKDTYKSYVNLSHRTDRFIHMENELARVGISAKRFPAFKTSDHHWDDYKTAGMVRRGTLGAIGCHYSQVKVMQYALDKGKSAFVMEDDLIFCTDIKERLDYIEAFLNKQESWDVVWLGGTFSVNPPYWHKIGHNSELPNCICNLGRDVEQTEDPRMMRTYGCFSTFAYIVNYRSLQKILDLLDDNVHLSMGIDWEFILLQPRLKTFAFVPGCVKQMDNKSDIGHGDTIFSQFESLGPYWFQDRMDEFDPTTFDWHEAKKIFIPQ